MKRERAIYRSLFGSTATIVEFTPKSNTMRPALVNKASMLILASTAFIAACNRGNVSYRSPAEVATAMTQESQGHHFDRAIQIGQDWVRSHPDDSLIYNQIAMVFCLQASRERDPPHKRQLLVRASDDFEKSVQVEPHDPLSVLTAALGFEGIAKLSSDEDRCGYYIKADATLKRMEPLLVKDEYLLKNGQTIPVAPMRTSYHQLTSKLSEEMNKARCR